MDIQRKPPALKGMSRSVRPEAQLEIRAHSRPELGEGNKVEPHMVCYGDSTEVCKNCVNFSGSSCSLLSIPVGPDDHCNAFTGNDGSEQGEHAEQEEMEQER